MSADSGGRVDLNGSGIPGQVNAAFQRLSNWVPLIMLLLNVAVVAFAIGQVWRRVEQMDERLSQLEKDDREQRDTQAKHTTEIAVLSTNVGAIRESVGRIEQSVTRAIK